MLTGIAVLLMFVAVGFFAIDEPAPLHRPANEALRKTVVDYMIVVDRGRREIYRLESGRH